MNNENLISEFKSCMCGWDGNYQNGEAERKDKGEWLGFDIEMYEGI